MIGEQDGITRDKYTGRIISENEELNFDVDVPTVYENAESSFDVDDPEDINIDYFDYSLEEFEL